MSNTAREDQWEDFFNYSNVVRFDRRTKISLRDFSDRNFLIEKFIYTLYTGCPAKKCVSNFERQYPIFFFYENHQKYTK